MRASVRYTIPASAAPVSTAVRAARTFVEVTMRGRSASQSPSCWRNAFAYTPAGTASGSPMAMRLNAGSSRSGMPDNVRGRPPGTTTASRFVSRLTRVPSATNPARATRSIWASSALMNRSTGAPFTIWRASTLDPPKLNRTGPPPADLYCSAAAVSASVRLMAADTVTAGGVCGAAAAIASSSASARYMDYSLIRDVLRGRRTESPQKHERPRLHADLLPRLHLAPAVLARQMVAGFVGVQDQLPAEAPLPFGKDELERLVVRVEHDVEAVVDDPLAALVHRGDRGSVQEDAERLREAGLPVLVRHLDSRRREPADVADVVPADRAPLKPAAAAEHGVRVAQRDQMAGELEQLLVRVLPVVPRDLVVLAVRVVVPLLRAADLVAAADHGNALREQQGRQ